MILFVRASDVGIDARYGRYAEALRRRGEAFETIHWASENAATEQPRTTKAYSANPYRDSTLAKLLALVGFNLFAFYHLVRMRGDIRLVHAIDLDTGVAVMVFSRLFKVPFIYDVYDHYAQSRNLTGLCGALAIALERQVMRRAEQVILADECRRDQHGDLGNISTLVIENVASAGTVEQRPGRFAKAKDGCLHIGYLGTLEASHRGLEHLIEVASEAPGLELHIGGAGVLEPLVQEAAARHANIHFHGAMDHAQGLHMLSRCDVLAGLYYSSNPNHRFAAPNKYFEHLLLGKPLLTSASTPPGEKVSRDATGWVVEDDKESLLAALLEMQADRQELERRGVRARRIWTSRFRDYFERQIAGDYIDAVRVLMRERRRTARAPSDAAREMTRA